MERRPSRNRFLHFLYLLGVWFKGIDGILEVVGGVLLLVVSEAAVRGIVATLTRHELSEDPDDWVATHLRMAVSHLSANTRLFAAAYLLGHGAIKIFLVWGGLLRGKRWAFPTAIGFLALFIGYQIYRTIDHFSLCLTTLTVVDFIVLLLIWREYRIRKESGRGAVHGRGEEYKNSPPRCAARLGESGCSRPRNPV